MSRHATSDDWAPLDAEECDETAEVATILRDTLDAVEGRKSSNVQLLVAETLRNVIGQLDDAVHAYRMRAPVTGTADEEESESPP